MVCGFAMPRKRSGTTRSRRRDRRAVGATTAAVRHVAAAMRDLDLGAFAAHLHHSGPVANANLLHCVVGAGP